MTERQSIKAIGKHCDVSVTTVQRTLSALSSDIRQNLEYLPRCLLFDEFRSLSTWHGKFSFLVWTVRPGNCLRSYLAAVKRSRCFFHAFSLKARLGVHYIVTDMNAPYFSLVKECFPNAQVIVDRFHIVQHLNRFFDAVRKRVMKHLIKRPNTS